MERYCRGCLVRYEEPTELLQYTEKNRRLFVYCTGLQVKRTDAFTFQLCRGCYMNMKVACSFKKQCRNSDRLFRSYQGLRDNEENVDLSTFLKNNDDSWTFRFPGSSTPAYQRAKDDDNESTTTSIRNFMNDIMPDELPDTEARIIREVIDEEADVLDDSLDSHWLQDDASIDSDFRLDFSFSPFSTPRPVNNDRYTPKKIIKTEKSTEPTQVSVKKVLDNLDMPKPLDNIVIPKVLDNLDMPKVLDNLDMPENLGNLDMPLIGDESNQDPLAANMPAMSIKQERIFDETMDTFDVVNDFLKYESENNNQIEPESAPQCTIDRNLEEALKNTDNKEFSLDELLVSPKVPEIRSPATPFINNILFGDKLDIDENSNSSQKYKSGQCIENFENVTGDVDMEEFTVDIDIKLEEIDLDELKTEMIEELNKEAKQEKENRSHFNITNFYCNMCQMKFKSLLALQRHSRLQHQTGIKPPRVLICDYCAREFNNRTNFVRHLRNHQRATPSRLQCDICKMDFRSQNALKQHKRTHTGEEQVLKPCKKKYVCPICGSSTDKASNHTVHMKRHNKSYTHTCPECNKGFYRQAELTIHMRYHTGERPFPCLHCDMRFARTDSLSKHIKTHLDLRPFQCVYCKSRFINSTNLKNHLKKSTRCIKDRDTISRKQKDEEDSTNENSIVTEETLVKVQDKEEKSCAIVTYSRRNLQKDVLPSEEVSSEHESVNTES